MLSIQQSTLHVIVIKFSAKAALCRLLVGLLKTVGNDERELAWRQSASIEGITPSLSAKLLWGEGGGSFFLLILTYIYACVKPDAAVPGMLCLFWRATSSTRDLVSIPTLQCLLPAFVCLNWRNTSSTTDLASIPTLQCLLPAFLCLNWRIHFLPQISRQSWRCNAFYQQSCV